MRDLPDEPTGQILSLHAVGLRDHVACEPALRFSLRIFRPTLLTVHTSMRKRNVHKRGRKISVPQSADAWFDRELADINARLASLEAALTSRSLTTPKPRHRKAPKRKSPSGTKLAVAPSISPAAPPLQVAAAPPVSSAAPDQRPPSRSVEPVLPTGTNLSDPKNFGLMPPAADLERGSATDDEYRRRLARHIAFATKVLHTSGVPAAIWREWRAFEKAAHERLRALTSPSHEAVEQT